MKQIAPKLLSTQRSVLRDLTSKPLAGARLEGPVRQLLAQQREKLHSRGEGQQVVDQDHPTQKFV